jgi:AcrR family transcriptional regulator
MTSVPSFWQDGHDEKRNIAPLNIRNVAPFCKETDIDHQPEHQPERASLRKRADARRNEQALLAAAAAVFVTSGVQAPVRDIAAQAGVGMGTIYRHFPTRADLIIAVYQHQVDACAEAGPALLAGTGSPHAALARWIDLFVDFLITKHGLAAALQSDKARFETLHAYFLDRLVPVCAGLLQAAVDAGEIRPDVRAYEFMRGIGGLCAGAGIDADDAGDSRYDARRLVGLLVAGLLQPVQPAR